MAHLGVVMSSCDSSAKDGRFFTHQQLSTALLYPCIDVQAAVESQRYATSLRWDWRTLVDVVGASRRSRSSTLKLGARGVPGLATELGQRESVDACDDQTPDQKRTMVSVLEGASGSRAAGTPRSQATRR